MDNKKIPDDVEYCDFCGFETKGLNYFEEKVYGTGKRKPTTGYLCNLCYSTLASNAFIYPSQYENTHVMKQISYIGNVILKAINERRK